MSLYSVYIWLIEHHKLKRLSNQLLNDIDFVGQLVPTLRQDYLDAKSFIRDVPTQSLLKLRRLAYGLTQKLAANKLNFNSTNLYERIEQLNHARLIDVPTARGLHKLRSYANKGAHPEKYHLAQDQLEALATKALKDWLCLLEHLYFKWHRQTVPKYQFIEPLDSASRDLCFRAVMDDDAEAQYLLGMAFKSKALLSQTHSATEVSATANSDKYLAKAAYWFEQASSVHDKALFEYGLARLHGYQGQRQEQGVKGEQAIEKAADKGISEAQALLGYFYLVGTDTIESNSDKALYYLTLAANNEQIEAIANLGVLYYQQGDLNRAYHFIAKAAKAGFPNAQYHLALMLQKGEACEKDLDASEQWLAEAAEQGQTDAMLERARHMLNDEQSFGSDLTQAETYLRQVILYDNKVAAMLELSTALADASFGRVDVVGAAALLEYAHGFATKAELEVIRSLRDSLLEQITRVLTITTNKDEKTTLEKAQGLLNFNIKH